MMNFINCHIPYAAIWPVRVGRLGMAIIVAGWFMVVLGNLGMGRAAMAAVPEESSTLESHSAGTHRWGIWSGTLAPLSAGAQATWRFLPTLEADLHGGFLPAPYAQLVGELVDSAHESAGAVVEDALTDSLSAGVGLRFFPIRASGAFVRLSVTAVFLDGGMELERSMSEQTSSPLVMGTSFQPVVKSGGFPDEISDLPVPGNDDGDEGAGGDDEGSLGRVEFRGVMPMVGLSLGYRIELGRGFAAQAELGVGKSVGVSVEMTRMPADATDEMEKESTDYLKNLLWEYGLIPTAGISVGRLF